MKNIMVDLETLSTTKRSAFVSIGAVAFDPDGTSVPKNGSQTFYRNVDIQSSIDADREVSGDTIYWWLRQSEEARRSLINPAPIALAEALKDFEYWFKANTVRGSIVWSHGATFDVPIIEEAFTHFRLKAPWFFSNANDTRTIFRLADLKLPAADTRVGGHNSLADSIAQAEHLQLCLAKLLHRETITMEIGETDLV